MTTLLATFYVREATRSKDQVRFRSEVRWTSDLIDERINIYIGLLRGGAAFLAANSNPTAQQFRAFVHRLKLPQHYPGIQGVGFAKRVRLEEKAALIQTLRAQGDPSFEIRPSGQREEYYPIVFLFPLDERNQHAIGYDMFSEPVRHEAMARARDEGRSVASGKVTLVQEIYEQKQAGFLIYLPAYSGGTIPSTVAERREKILGFVYSPFRSDDLFAGIFAREMQPRVHFEVYDGEQTLPGQLLHRSTVAPSRTPEFSTTRIVHVAGRRWTILFQTTPQFEAASNRRLVPWVLGSGLLLSLLLAGITAALARTQRELQHAQAELRAHADTLEQTVAERTAKLRETVAELEHLSYSITHDMRAPLRAIQSFATLLQEEAGHCLNAESQDYLTRMRTAANRMDALIRDVFNYSKLVRAELPLQPTDVAQLVRGIVETYPMFHPPKAQVEVDPDLPPVLGNEAALTQCFSNLLDNAVKFAKPGQTPAIHVSGERKEGFVRIYVTDNGIGIPKALQNKIFGMFQRLSSATEGTGVGLAIVRKATERMGGRVGLESEPGHGSCFWLDLKPAPAPGGQGNPLPAPPR